LIQKILIAGNQTSADQIAKGANTHRRSHSSESCG
jgi:hypothetical protein